VSVKSFEIYENNNTNDNHSHLESIGKTYTTL